MTASTIDTLVKLLSILTLKRVGLFTVFCLIVISMYTLFEHRQLAYDSVTEMKIPTEGKYDLKEPNSEQKTLIDDLVKSNPSVIQISVVDADPIKNFRKVLYTRTYDKEFETFHEKTISGKLPTGPLFSTDQQSNEHIVNLLSGEIRCAPSNEGFYYRMYPEFTRFIKYSCRIPLPPAYGKVTGWLSVHFAEWPLRDFGKTKYDMLNLANDYYLEELKK